MTKHLDIRSEEVSRLANAIAARLDISVTDTVLRALREFGSRLEQHDELTPSQQQEYDALRAIAREASAHRVPGATSDHSDMYDEYGLPI